MNMLTLTEAQVDSVALLRDDPDVLAILGRARLSRNKAFLAAIVQAGRARAAFEVLAQAQRRAPTAVDRILTHPRFGAWAAGSATHERMSGAERLAAFAAAAAVRAGVPFDLEAPTPDGALVLPSLGALTGLTGPGLRIRSSGAGNPFAARPDWRGLRLLRARSNGGTLAVELDEFPLAFADGASPFPALAELRTEDREQWQSRFVGAVELIEWAVPELGGPLTRGMRSVIPIALTRDGASLATQTDAFGAAAMILPDSDAAMAAALLHEFQHSKLAALSELVPLVADDTMDLYSPWRTEPRPASAVLHGAFAHAAVALLWSRLATRWQGGPAAQAWTEAELARAQTLLACADLATSGRLTPAGRRFVSLLHRCTRHMAAAPSPGTRRLAQDRLAAHRSDWNRRQRRTSPGDYRTTTCTGSEAMR